jgi:cytochrome c2
MKISAVVKPVLSWLAFHVAGLAWVVLVPSQLFLGDSIWRLGAEQRVFVAGIALAHVAGAVLASLRRLDGAPFAAALNAAVSCLAAFGTLYLWLLLAKQAHSRPLLLVAPAVSIVLIALSFWREASAVRASVVLIAAASVAMQILGDGPSAALRRYTAGRAGAYHVEATANTSLYSVRVHFFEDYFCQEATEPCRAPRNGGGISDFGAGYLAATGDGALYFVTYDEAAQALSRRRLPYRIPINSEEFVAAGNAQGVGLFRVADILVQGFGDRFRLLAAHHHWNAGQRCFTIRVSSIEDTYTAFIAGDSAQEWKTLHETAPCLPVDDPLPHSSHKARFSGDESGGRMVLLAPDRLLLSVGDHLFNGYDRAELLAQDDVAQYGKTILIDLSTGEWSVYTKGHRNPQGLYVDPSGVVWEAEHGPRGGDELNVLHPGHNYGWPLVTYGTDYGKHSWPPNDSQGDHQGFERSIYSWVPSAAISNVMMVNGGRFALWRGDLLAGSYNQALWRLRVRESRVAYAEPITLRSGRTRIRDLMEDEDGRIVLWLDGGTLAFLTPDVEEERGAMQAARSPEQEFLLKCGTCHVSSAEQANAPGPDLRGVIDRDIAGVDGYSYSNALAARAGTWSEDKLDAYLEDPQRFAPGTSMVFEGISDAAERSRIIEYLGTLRD